MLRIGSLFSGAGGLDMAVEQVFGGHTAWHSENDPAASKVLAARWPGVPNHHDITAVDWATVDPVDILCGGWPCQPFSLAGKRKGADDERALWPYVARAVRMVRPRIVVLENVSAVLGPEFQRVANDLAALGYDIAWTCIRASDVGAPHQRNRLFAVATDTTGERWTGPDESRAHMVGHRPQSAHADSHGRTDVGLLPTPAAARSGRSQLLPTPRATRGGSSTETVELLPTPTTCDHKPTDSKSDHDRHSPGLGAVTYHFLPTPSVADGMGGHLTRSGTRSSELLLPGVARTLLPTPNAADGARGQDFARANRDGSGGDDLVTAAVKAANASQWGKYAGAIERWESVTRPAPSPTEPNRNGNPRLAPAFSEWLMGWPAGWVTEVPGISRNDQLRIIGNGVVPQCAAAAIRWLLSVACEVVA